MILGKKFISNRLMSTRKVAERMVQLCRENKRADAVDELYSDTITSIVLKGDLSEKVEGKLAVSRKIYEWNSATEQIRDLSISDPVVKGNYFTCIVESDVFMKGGVRVKMSEVCIYKVQYGKIVFEQFFLQ